MAIWKCIFTDQMKNICMSIQPTQYLALVYSIRLAFWSIFHSKNSHKTIGTTISLYSITHQTIAFWQCALRVWYFKQRNKNLWTDDHTKKNINHSKFLSPTWRHLAIISMLWIFTQSHSITSFGIISMALYNSYVMACLFGVSQVSSWHTSNWIWAVGTNKKPFQWMDSNFYHIFPTFIHFLIYLICNLNEFKSPWELWYRWFWMLIMTHPSLYHNWI